MASTRRFSFFQFSACEMIEEKDLRFPFYLVIVRKRGNDISKFMEVQILCDPLRVIRHCWIHSTCTIFFIPHQILAFLIKQLKSTNLEL